MRLASTELEDRNMKLSGCETLHAEARWRILSYLWLSTDEALAGTAELKES